MPAGFVDEKKQFPRQQITFVVDGLGTVCGSLMGTSPIATYIESAAGIRDGGRSGITALTCSFYFFVSLFFVPVLSAPASAPPPSFPRCLPPQETGRYFVRLCCWGGGSLLELGRPARILAEECWGALLAMACNVARCGPASQHRAAPALIQASELQSGASGVPYGISAGIRN